MGQDQVEDRGYLPIALDSLRLDIAFDFDLYLRSGSDMVLYRSAGQPFGPEQRDKLVASGTKQLFTSPAQRASYQRYLEANLVKIIRDSSIDDFTKASIAYDASKWLVKDILANPTLGENIRRGHDFVEVSVGHILENQNAFGNLLKVMSFDYTTYSHSVNVCTFAVALAKFLGIDDQQQLNNLGVGALLHDVGKTSIPTEILNKHAALDEEEFQLVRQHPLVGQELIRQTDLVNEECYYPVIQHHEREDGSGYPYGLKSDDIHLFGKIVGIVDVFDAMTTQRSYRNAVETFHALMVMYGDKELFDVKILEQFTQLMGPRQMLDS